MENIIILTFVRLNVVKKVNIALRKDVHSQAKIISILKNVSLNKYLELCIEKAMKEDQSLLQQILEVGKTEQKFEDDNED